MVDVGVSHAAFLEGALRLSRESATDALLEVLRAHQTEHNPIPQIALRRHASGVIFGLQQMLLAETMLVRFTEELGEVLCGLTTGSEDALVAITMHLEQSLRSQIPADLAEALSPSIRQVIARLMRGWIGRSQRTAEDRGSSASAFREHPTSGAGDGFLRSVIDQAPVGFRMFHLQTGAVIVHNAAMQRLFGYTREEEAVLPPEQLKNEDSADDDFDLFADMIGGRIPYVERISARPHKDGQSVPFRMLGWPVRDADGITTHVADVYMPMAGQSSQTAGGGLSERRSRYLQQISPDPMVIADATGIIRYASPSIESTMGHDPDQVVGKHIRNFILPDSQTTGEGMLDDLFRTARAGVVVELEALLADGTSRWFEVVGRNLLDVEDVQGIVLQGRDVTDRVMLRRALETAVRTDNLTGLLNRQGFDERLQEVMRSFPDEANGSVALVCYSDLDLFKAINDTHGHAAGDAVLAAIGGRLRELVDGNGFAGRMGGDEFTVFTHLPTQGDVEDFCEHLADALSGTREVDGAEVSFSGSYGAVVVTGDSDDDTMRDVRDLLVVADRALGESKRSRVGGIVVR